MKQIRGLFYPLIRLGSLHACVLANADRTPSKQHPYKTTGADAGGHTWTRIRIHVFWPTPLVLTGASSYACVTLCCLALWVVSRNDREAHRAVGFCMELRASSRASSFSASSPALLERVRSRSVFREFAPSSRHFDSVWERQRSSLSYWFLFRAICVASLCSGALCAFL